MYKLYLLTKTPQKYPTRTVKKFTQKRSNATRWPPPKRGKMAAKPKTKVYQIEQKNKQKKAKLPQTSTNQPTRNLIIFTYYIIVECANFRSMLNCVNNLEPQSMNSGIERAALMISEEKTQHDSRKTSFALSTTTKCKQTTTEKKKYKHKHTLFVCLSVSVTLCLHLSLSTSLLLYTVYCQNKTITKTVYLLNSIVFTSIVCFC